MISFLTEIRSSLLAYFPNEKSEELQGEEWNFMRILRMNPASTCWGWMDHIFLTSWFYEFVAFPKNLWTWDAKCAGKPPLLQNSFKQGSWEKDMQQCSSSLKALSKPHTKSLFQNPEASSARHHVAFKNWIKWCCIMESYFCGLPLLPLWTFGGM